MSPSSCTLGGDDSWPEMSAGCIVGVIKIAHCGVELIEQRCGDTVSNEMYERIRTDLNSAILEGYHRCRPTSATMTEREAMECHGGQKTTMRRNK